MNNTQSRTMAIFAILAVLMAVTRFNHFGSAISLPDASLAVFFLGGLYLARFGWASVTAFLALILEAGLVDHYATSVQGVVDWCITPAYLCLVPAYGGLWLAGRWFAFRHTTDRKWVAGLALTAGAAISLAFLISNTAFYVYSGYFSGLSASEYALNVVQYYGSYVSVALLYIACAAGVQRWCVVRGGGQTKGASAQLMGPERL